MALGPPPGDSVRGLAPCFIPPRLLQTGGSFCRTLPAASDAPVRGAEFTPGRSSRGAYVVLHSAPVAPIRGVFLLYSPRCLGRSSPWHRVHPRTIQSGGLRRAAFLPGCSNPGGFFVIFSLLPRTLQSVAPGSPPGDPARGLAPCLIPPRLLQFGGSLCHILSAALDAPVRGTRFTPDDPVRGLAPCFIPPRLLQSGGSFCLTLPAAWDAPVRGAGFTPGRSSLGKKKKKGGVCCVVCVVSWDTWFVFSGVGVCCGVRGVRCAVLRVRCPGSPGPCSPVRTPGLWCCVGGVLGRLARVACSVCCVLCAVSWATWLLFTGVRAQCVAWCVRCGCGRVLACAIPLLRRCGPVVLVYTWLDTVGNGAANSPLASRPPRRPASYGVLLILPVLDSLVLATPKSKRVLMHARWCMLFTRWFVDSLHFATPKSRRVCLMHSWQATYS